MTLSARGTRYTCQQSLKEHSDTTHSMAAFMSSTPSHLLEKNPRDLFFVLSSRREQAVEKKYPGTYKRHPVRPIIHPNTVEKLMKRKGVSHKPGGQTKR